MTLSRRINRRNVYLKDQHAIRYDTWNRDRAILIESNIERTEEGELPSSAYRVVSPVDRHRRESDASNNALDDDRSSFSLSARIVQETAVEQCERIPADARPESRAASSSNRATRRATPPPSSRTPLRPRRPRTPSQTSQRSKLRRAKESSTFRRECHLHPQFFDAYKHALARANDWIWKLDTWTAYDVAR